MASGGGSGKALQRARAVARRWRRIECEVGGVDLCEQYDASGAGAAFDGDAGYGDAAPAPPPAPLAINARQIEKSATVYAVFAIE